MNNLASGTSLKCPINKWVTLLGIAGSPRENSGRKLLLATRTLRRILRSGFESEEADSARFRSGLSRSWRLVDAYDADRGALYGRFSVLRQPDPDGQARLLHPTRQHGRCEQISIDLFLQKVTHISSPHFGTIHWKTMRFWLYLQGSRRLPFLSNFPRPTPSRYQFSWSGPTYQTSEFLTWESLSRKKWTSQHFDSTTTTSTRNWFQEVFDNKHGWGK